MDLILPILTGVIIVGLIVYAIFRPKRPPTELETLPKDAPLTVPPERAALGVQAVLRREKNRRGDRLHDIGDLTFRPAGDLIAGNSHRGLVYWISENGAVFPKKTYRHWGGDFGFGPIAWSRDGERIVLDARSQSSDILNLFHVADAKLLVHVTVKDRDVDRVVFSPDDDLIAWKGQMTLGVWDPEMNENREWKPEREPHVLEFVRHETGRPALLTRDGFGVFSWHDPVSQEVFDELETEYEEMWLGLLADGKYALSETHTEIRVREVRTGEVVATIEQEEACVRGFWSDRRMKRVAIGTDDGRIILWRPLEGKVTAEVKVVEKGPVEELTGSESGALVCRAGYGGVAEIWNLSLMENVWRSKEAVD